MIFTRNSSAASPEWSRGASPERSDCSLGGDDRSPSLPSPRASRGITGMIQTTSAAVSLWGSPKRGGAEKKSGAKSDPPISPPRGRTMTQSVSRGAFPAVSAGKSRRPDADKVKSAAAYCQPLDTKYPDCVGAPSDSRGSIPLLISLRFVLSVPVPEAKVSNATMAVISAALGTACESVAGPKLAPKCRTKRAKCCTD